MTHTFKISALTFTFMALLGMAANAETTVEAKANVIVKTETETPEGKNVIFHSYPRGEIADQVDAMWRKVPEYQSFVKVSDMVPQYMLGLADLNGDGRPEVFARQSDDELGFCDIKGNACQMHIYVRTDGGLIEIGRFRAGEPVTISSHKTDGIRDLIVIDSDNKKQTYVWNKSVYKLK